MSVEALEIEIEKRFGTFELVLEAALPLTGVTAVFGPSGSGKSSLLRLIAGFERPDRGIIRFGAHIWTSDKPIVFQPPHKRRVAYVFQDGRLLQNLNVHGNLAFADKRARSNANQAYSFDDVVQTFALETLMTRKPATLSGGERQRVTLAQALLTRPELLLLDEPLSALDSQSKREILPFLDRLQSDFALPMLYVSHDLRDVTRMADRVLMLKKGRMQAFGETVQTLNAFGFETSEAGKSGVILTGRVSGFDQRHKLMEVTLAQNSLRIPYQEAAVPGSSVRVILRASDVALSLQPPDSLSIQNSLQGHVLAIRSAPEHAMADVTVQLAEGSELPVRVTRAAIDALGLEPGKPVFALVKTASLLG